MGPEATSEYFNISGSIQSTNTSLFLNIGSESTSYKTLTLGTTATMSAWALEGDTIITAQTSSYGRREFTSNFTFFLFPFPFLFQSLECFKLDDGMLLLEGNHSTLG